MSVKVQPPPRKGKVTTALKNIHNEQLVKLQMKHQQDSDFLDDIRNFSKMRAVIEKDYAQALLKLATTHLQKKGPLGPDMKPKDGESHNTVYGVWKTLLDETEKIAKARLAATEVYQQQVSEGAKSLRLYKLQCAKKCFESLKKMHEEIQTCVTEIDKSKKLYFEEEHMAHEAREKAHDADEKLKRKKGRIFQSISSLQKNSAKFSFRREACDIQATKARNDYVLALIAANAHQNKFYENDLPELVQYLDCDMYDKVKEYILLIAHTELLTCAACQASFNKVQEQANTASKQFTMECFFRDNPVLSQTILYEFEPCDNDQINKLSVEHNAALCLSKEAKRWISCVAKEVRVIRESKEELKKLLAQIGDKPDTLQSDQIGPQAELEARIDELRQIIRKSETSKKKAEARLEAMKEAGVNVEDWVKTSDTESVSASESPAEVFSRSGTVTSRSSRQSYQSSEVFEGSVEVNDAAFYDSDTAEPPTSAAPDSAPETSYMPDLTSAIDVVAAVQEAWDAAAETEEIEEPEPVPVQEPAPMVNGEVAPQAPGQRCVALFSYEATNSDELSFVEQEELELINEGDGDGWVMARNYRGEEGYIPQNYVEIVEPQAAESSSRPPLTSFSSVDYTMPSEDIEAGIDVNTQPPPAEPEPVPPPIELATTEIQRPRELPSTERISVCQAIYDYEATCDEELSFFEGQIIKIIRKKVCDVDDGWWEGELDGQIGLFPSLVVEELKENGEPITPETPLSPPEAPPPPAFTPPEAQLVIPPAAVILTQPTPEMENAKAQPQAVILSMDEDFHNELNKNQQSQPQEQFSASDTESSEHDTAAADNPVSYAPLVSSPDSPTKTVADSIKETTSSAEGETKEEINSEITSPSAGTDECPTVVITAITGGDTPVSDEDMEIKEEVAPPEKTEAKQETAAVEKSDTKKETAPAPAAESNPDAFECSFDDDFGSQPPPPPPPVVKESQATKSQTAKEVEQPVKMEINGSDKGQSFQTDGNFFSGVSESSETTG
ncbi:protein nervous wreck-like isoform X2 [Argiope bruennichi]|uniref:protein nervous wreck-like isoform X2 n=1 Tax=Argiope bruennichi TaxID=94029 RepID=UPI002493F74F|nr:protein nervous wreck-like isoform X2 [Argiope bruennichi]